MRLKGGIADRAQFMCLVYGDETDVGAESFSVISVHLTWLRKALAPTGYTITLNRGLPKRGWRLQKITA